MGEGPQGKVWTIPPGVPFVDALAAGLLERDGGEPLALARVTILLPTRRACRSVREAFLRQRGGQALILPRMRPLGDLGDEDIVLDDEAGETAENADLPPAISPMRRQLLLTRLILKWGEAGAATADQAARLAAEFARLIDQVETERLGFDALAKLVPEDYAEHWQATLRFLKIVTEHWPAILAEQELVDPAERRNRALAALARRWRTRPPADPVVAAGSTGTVPATADLLAVIATLPKGEVVLPGLDHEADDATWQSLDETHPQYALKRLLERLEVDRGEVKAWPLPEGASLGFAHPARARFLAEALRPAATTDAWRDLKAPPKEALDGLTRIDAPGPQQEAGVIALRMREALDEEGRTAALVTRDRSLARRVAAELRRWGIEVDDSAGQPLADTVPGTFLRLTAALVVEHAAPVTLLAALKHPLAAGGMTPGAFRGRVRAFERAVLRGPRPGEGFAGLEKALKAATGKGGRALSPWLARLRKAAAPFARLAEGSAKTVDSLVRAHVAFAEELATSRSEPGAERLWAGEAGEAVAAFVAALLEAAPAMAPIGGDAYPALIDALMAGRVVRPRFGRHPRLQIWGPLEARLQSADIMILGGLNEGSWPPEPAADPWLSRPMRAEFGLPSPERRIGLAAHDFVQCACAPSVVLTRADKVEGMPTVPARWLLRLDNLLSRTSPEWPAGGAARDLLGWQMLLDRPNRVEPAGPPAPNPPLAVRPRKLSVTQVETWMRDPYAIYARHILGLKALDPVDADPGAAEYGSIIHDALDRFVRSCPGALPDDAYDRLLDCGRRAFAETVDRPGVWVFWWPRFERIAWWFIEQERARRAGLAAVASEVQGGLVVEGPAGSFTLTAQADRIERRADGRLVVIDYKTGALPKVADIKDGYAPQLPLEALMAAADGFEGVPAAAVAELAHWRLTGGEPPGEVKPLKDDPADMAERAGRGLKDLIARFDDPATSYVACPQPDVAPRFSDYAHLARIKEWSTAGEKG
ncbi:MAG: double-strand break repair protein AddB [Alphaproteobacteria bacterium]